MKIKEGVIKVVKFVFPYGNWRWYLVYIPIMISFFISITLYAVFMNMIDQGISIQTDTFYAYMPFSQSHLLNQFDWDIIGFLYSAAENTLYVFFAHTCLSFIVDCGVLIYNKIVLPVYRWWMG